MSTEFNENEDSLKVDPNTFHDVPVEERRHVQELDITNEDEDIRPVNDTPPTVITVSVLFLLFQVVRTTTNISIIHNLHFTGLIDRWEKYCSLLVWV